MGKTDEIYSIDGLDIHVNAVGECIEAKSVNMSANYRIKLAKNSVIPFQGRFHCSIASAEPVIPTKVYDAMLAAVKQHTKNLTAKPAQSRTTAKSS